MGNIWHYLQLPDLWVAASAGIVINVAAALLKAERDWLWRKRRASIADLTDTMRPRIEMESGPPFVLLLELRIKECRSDGWVFLVFGVAIHVVIGWLTSSLGLQMRYLLVGMGGCVTVWCVVHATLNCLVAADTQKRLVGQPRPPTGFRGW
jgi:hypothetical protein